MVMQPPAQNIGRPLAFDEVQRNAVYRAIGERRDVRKGYLPEALPEELMTRLLTAAHNAPSVGLMQPSRFIIIRSREIRSRIHSAFCEANKLAGQLYEGERREQYGRLKLEGILDAPQNLCVLCDPQSNQGHGLGRQSMPETSVYSTVCAVQNLWLAARAEGVGVGWVSILSPDTLRSILNIPAEIIPVAYLCLGYVEAFGDSPELERAGWEQRAPLQSCVSYEIYAAKTNLGAGR
jgi:5,6-dimethylbenzimidazole synthase